MALIDLANYDILDLLCINFMTDEEKGGYVIDYMEAFSDYLSEAVAGQFSDEDEEKLQKMILDPVTKPEDVEKFYKDKIPDYDSFLLAGTLKFKKEFLLDFYRNMLEETTKQNDPSVEYWTKIVAVAEQDDWNQVQLLINLVSEKFITSTASQPEEKTPHL